MNNMPEKWRDADIKPAVFVLGCIFVASILSYYTGKQNRVEVQRTVYITNWVYEVPNTGTNLVNFHSVEVKDEDFVPIPRYHIPPSIAGTNVEQFTNTEWSMWSAPETIRSGSTWVILQYRTNLLTGSLEAKAIATSP